MPEGAYNTRFEPAARPDDHVYIPSEDDTFVVNDMMVQPGLALDTITVPDGSVDNNHLITGLKMPKSMLGQFRLLDTGTIPAGVTVEIDMGGKEASAYTAKNERGRWDSNTIGSMPRGKATELWVYEDDDVYFTIANDSGGPVNLNFVFRGFHFKLAPDTADQSQTVYIPNRNIRER